MRLFTALEIVADARDALLSLEPIDSAALLQDQPHITLRYIGDVSEAMASAISKELRDIRLTRFAQTISGVGAFYCQEAPNYLWAGVDKSAELTALYNAIGSALLKLGVEAEQREYVPHVTLAKLHSSDHQRVEAYIAKHANFDVSVNVNYFCLYASERVNGKSVYKKLEEYKLR